MPRARSGNVEWRGGMWKAHVWFPGPPKCREWVPLEGIPATDREAAKEAALAAQEIVDQHGYVPSFRGETVNEWTEKKWLPLRKKLFPASWTNDKSNFGIYIAGDLGILPMRGLTRDHGRALCRKLDDLVLARTIAEATAQNIWYTATRMTLDATRSNEPGVAVLDANPFADIEGPTAKGVDMEKQLLYPDEFIRLVSCEDVPLLYARLYTVAIYTHVREAEELALDWNALDLAHGRIHVHQSVDYVRDDGRTAKPTKGRMARRYRIEAELLPLLEAMHRESGGKGLLFPEPPTVTGDYGLAEMLKRHLKVAGVERAELLKRTETTRPIRFQDLRATGVTWRLARGAAGDAPILVQQDAGHKSFQTTEKYIRLAGGFDSETVFPPLPPRLLGAKKTTGRKGPRKAQAGQSTPKTSEKQWAQQGLNL